MRRSLVLLTTLLMAGSSLSLHAQSALATTTTLAVGPSNSVAFEQTVTLTATITDSNNAAVLLGTVTFYDGTTALGTSSIIRNASAGFTPGTAIFRTRSLAQAAHSLTATFNGTKADQKSTSAAQSVTITAAAGPYPSVTQMSYTNSGNGEYVFNSTVAGFGPDSPTGSVTINDITASTSLGTANLATGAFGLLSDTSSLGLPQYDTLCGGGGAVATGDFNNDGNLDLIVAASAVEYIKDSCETTFPVQTFLGNGNGTFTPLPAMSIPGGASVGQILVADFNGDGNLDLVIPFAGASNDTILLLGNGDGTFQPPVLLNSGLLVGYPPFGSYMATADFNGNGIPDLAVVSPGSGSSENVGIFLGNGDGTFTADGGLTEEDVSPAEMVAADINSDGHIDLVMAGSGIAVALGNGDGTFQNPVLYTPSFGGYGAGTYSLAVANLTGSGPPQILWGLGVGKGSQLSVVSWAGTSSTMTSYSVPSGATLNGIAVGDFTFRGKQDVAVYNSANGQIEVFPGNGDGTLQSAYTVPVSSESPGSGSPLVTGDFQNSGAADLAVAAFPIYTAGQLFNSGGDLYTLEPVTLASAPQISTTGVCGPQQVTANYSGDSNFVVSLSPAVTIGSGVAPQVIVSGQPAVVTSGTPFTATATVGPTCSVGTPPSGTVTFQEYTGGQWSTVAQVTLSGNPATASASVNTVSQPLEAIDNEIEVLYSGDTNWSAGSGYSPPFNVQGSTNLTIAYSGASTVASGTPITITGQLSTNLAGFQPTGTVTVLDNGTAIATATLSGNPPFALSFSINTSSKPFAAGSNVLSLSYGGDTYWLSSTSGTVTVTAATADTATLTSNLPGSLMALTGVSLQFTSVVAPIGSRSLPTGTVQFYDGTAAIGAPVTLAGGAANYISTSFASGSHSVSAKYSGDSNYPASTSNTIAFTVVTPPGTAGFLETTIYSPSIYQLLAGYTVPAQTLVGSSIAGPAPTGSVTVSTSTGTTLASGSLTETCKAGAIPGAANCSTVSLAITPPLGSYTLNTSYGGDSNWKAGAVTTSVIYQSVQGQPTMPAVSCSSTSPDVGSQISCTAAINWQWGYPVTVTGTAELLDNGHSIATATLPAVTPALSGPIDVEFVLNTASQPLTVGKHIFSAYYPGNASWLSATAASQTVTVGANVPGLTLTTNLGTYSSAVQNTPVTMTATAPAINGMPTPTGTVQFYIDGTAAGGPVTLTGGVASYTTSSLTSGSHTITASYSGDNLYGATTTNGSVVIVPQGPDTLAMIVSAPSTIPLGTTIPITGTLTVGAYGPTPTGNVALLDGTASIATAALSGKSPYALSFSVNTASSPLAPGAHSFSLKYAGSTQWAASASTAAAVTVSQALTTTAVTSSAATANAGASVTLTATVSSALTGSAPTGTVQFFDGTTALGSPVTLSNNTATYTTTSLAAGAHSITAVYSGSTDFAGSTSAAFTETIQSIALSSAAITGTVSPGQSASYTLTVTADGVNESTSFACSSLPKGAACSLNPQTVTGSGSTTLTITTTGSSAAAVPNPLRLWTVRGAPVLACVVLLIAPSRRRKQLLFLVLFAVIPALTVGCGGGGGGGCGTNCGSSNATPAGTYTIKVTSTTGSGSSAITATTKVTLTVQ